MKLSDAFPSRYLSQEDIGDDPAAELVLTIAAVRFETLKDNHGAEEDKPIMLFQERGSKPLTLNKINGAIIGKAYGAETDKWIGEKVILYVDPNVTFGGKVTGGIRVRIPPRDKAVTSYGKSSPPVDLLTLDQAVANVEAIGLTKDDLIGYLKANDRKAYNGARDTELVLNYVAANTKQNPTDPIGEDIPF